jgi:GR25 family glycosyltransferase involved in LPS biosynthesis
MLTPGEVGCILSHQKVFRKIIDEKLSLALIMEDDVDIAPSIHKILDYLEHADFSFDICFLGHHPLRLKTEPFLKISDSFELNRVNEIVWGAHGYVISLPCAIRMLEKTSEFWESVDFYTGDYRINNILCLYPNITTINKNMEMGTLEGPRFEKYFQRLVQKADGYTGNIIVYGCNSLGATLLQHYGDDKVSFMIDKNRAGEMINGKIVKKLEDIDYNNELFVISARNDIFIGEIAKAIQQRFPNAFWVSLSDNYDTFSKGEL